MIVTRAFSPGMATSLPTTTPNNVVAVDARDPNAGGASHTYTILTPSGASQTIQFQHGPRLEPSSVSGALDDDLLAIVEDRLSSFQAGPFGHTCNEIALQHVRAARESLADRVAERVARGVLGKNVT